MKALTPDQVEALSTAAEEMQELADSWAGDVAKVSKYLGAKNVIEQIIRDYQA